MRAAHTRTGIAAADFSRIRNPDLGRFTVDRLMAIINRLGSRVEVKSGCGLLQGSLTKRRCNVKMIEATQRKLSEAQFFFAHLVNEGQKAVRNEPQAFGFYLSAFLSAARSVTFVLQYEEKAKYG